MSLGAADLGGFACIDTLAHMRMQIKAFSLLLMISTVTSAATLYVSPSGDDHNPGTETRPFATLTRARDEIRNRPDQRPITVMVQGGTYRQTATLDLDARDSDSHWQAAAGQQMRIDGGIHIDPRAFEPVKDQTISHHLSDAARPHVLVADLASLGVKSVETWPTKFRGAPATPELFFNDQRMQIARWPNKGWTPIDKVIDPGADPRDGDKSGRLPTFTCADPRPRTWNTDAGVWLFGNWTYTWYDEVIRVKSIDRDTGHITLAEPALYSVKSGRFYAVNVLEELDQPGEFYIDAAHRRLYFWPPAPIENAQIALSLLNAPLLIIDKANNVTFSGMTFENGLDDAIHVQDSTRVRIERCTVRNVRMQAMRIEGGSDDVVDACEIYDTGSGGIYLAGGDRRTLTPAHQSVTNCRIHDFARIERTGTDACAIVVAGVGNHVAHNLIYNSPFQAIWILGNDNIVEYNDIHHVVTDTHDAGAVYKGRDPSCRGNVIRYNFFHDIGMSVDYGTCAIYFDDGDGGDSVIGNIFLRAGNPGKWATFGTIFSHGGFDILAQNNIFIDCQCPLGSSPWDYAQWKDVLNGGQDMGYRTKLLKDVDITSDVYVKHYPELAGFMNPKPDAPRVSHARNTVLVRCARIGSGNWQADPRTTWSTNTDPGFVDAAHDDFRERPDAELFKHLPDFKPIPFEQIGPKTSDHPK
jgi:hypothetical protein